MSLLYGISGSTNLNVIAQEAAKREDNTLLILALFLMLAGLCFKIAAVPFHMWAPDAYEGAPTGITAFMSVAVKGAAFAVFLRIFYVTFHDFHDLYMGILAIIAMATMTWGNVAAVTQQNVKRLLAYSSISHAGFVLMGLVVGSQQGLSASVVYLFAYTFMNLGAWAIVILLRRRDVIGESIEDFNGLYFKHPGLAILNLIFFLSLAGIPPLAGFIAKYAVFAAVIESAMAAGQAHGQLLMWLARGGRPQCRRLPLLLLANRSGHVHREGVASGPVELLRGSLVRPPGHGVLHHCHGDLPGSLLRPGPSRQPPLDLLTAPSGACEESARFVR